MGNIKFKFWNGFQIIENKDISYIDFNNKFVCIWNKYDCDYLQINFDKNNELMMFTGAYDVEGIEIYKGDIIETVRGLNHVIGEVIYYKCAWYIKTKDKNYYRLTPRFSEVQNKVLGNKYTYKVDN